MRMTQILIHLFLHLIFLGVALGQVITIQDQCLPTRCGDFGPVIRFPFRLKNRQPTNCGYPGFELSCTKDNVSQFMLQFPLQASIKNIVIPISANVSVQEIDYNSQTIRLSELNASCLPRQISNINSSASLFTFDPNSYGGFTLFNCSSNKEYSTSSDRINCLSGPHYDVLAFRSYYSISQFPSSCTKMYNISDVPNEVLFGRPEYSPTQIYLHWSEPFCGNCEADGKYCKLKSNGSGSETECADIPSKGPSKKVIVASVLGSVFAFALIILVVYKIVKLKIKKEDQKRIERFLEDYKALRPTRYSYADIKKITEQFKYKLGQGGYGKVYKGKLTNEILVAIKVLNNFKGDGEDFINEVGSIGRIHHVNVVRLVGYCADGYRRALVYEYLQNDTLQKIISSGNGRGSSLCWEKMQQIAVGIAKGIEYLHQGCNQRIVHFDIKPHNILLDQDFNPKVADFGLAKLCSKEQSAVSMTAARGTIGYIAPEVFSRNYGNVSYKADIYSFGMLLLDMIGGRKKFDAANEENSSSQIYYPEWMYKQLEKGEEIEIQIDNEDDSSIIKKLAIVGLWCIQWYPADRPSMKVVIQMLEGEGCPIMPPNPFGSLNSPNKRTTAEGSQFSSELGSSFETGTSSN
ncbi:rust resistance kinase Lr10 [Nicotiana tabacum]|uniref:Rust resistance kinase Lr10 n=2 Tax=Nicotiana TaxID=4085 RepID=A0A1S3Z0W0_TOBAC|nr:PREDICTED: rust resistance kinase Lr10-like [Nicotiana tabacum]XP_016458115.1 PREDICTED: rust resistance kinase Lr10-like [Nicotiana tabacum]XP_016458117.1 PREDICTED: rust resistance kinase Lr10-like [Nicotiana tabacum]XP_016458118.1 PREDICTED: rust resistance kinase Lr10-like [Nicotiana tabacum]